MLEQALNRYFATYDSTRILASELIRERKHPAEILILLCARLDALASDAATEEASSKRAFVDFVAAYGSNRKLLRSVSIGDLYYELAFHRWLLEGTIPEPGRLHRFSRVDDTVIQLLVDAGLPLTLEASELLLDVLMRVLKREFRAAPGQRLSKPRSAGASRLQELLADRVRRTRLKKIADNLPGALKPLLESKRIGTILYEKYRSEAILGAKVHIDPCRFFTDAEVYWTPLRSEDYGRFELIEFPARFLLSVLENCTKTYQAAHLAKGKIPPDVHFHAFSDEMPLHLDLLDESLLPKGGRVQFKTR